MGPRNQEVERWKGREPDATFYIQCVGAGVHEAPETTRGLGASPERRTALKPLYQVSWSITVQGVSKNPHRDKGV